MDEKKSYMWMTSYKIGDYVRHVMNVDKSGVIIGILIRENNYVEYQVVWNSNETGWHCEVELDSIDKQVEHY